MRYLQLFWQFFRANLKSQMEYRLNFVISVLVTVVLQFGNLFLIWVVLSKFQALKSWTFPEVAFLVGLRLLSHAIFVIFFISVRGGLQEYVVRGRFDRFLLRPINPLFHFLNSEVELRGFVDFSTGLAIFITASRMLNLSWNLIDLLFLMMVIMGALLIELGIYLLFESLAFWTTQTGAFTWIIFQLHEEYAIYPTNIYGRAVQFLLTFLIPFAFINFYPAGYFLQKSSVDIFHPLFRYLTPLIGLLCFAAAYIVWKKGMDRYQSTGS